MSTPDPIERLRTALGEIVDLERVAGLLGWDQQAMMPPSGARSLAGIVSRAVCASASMSAALGAVHSAGFMARR